MINKSLSQTHIKTKRHRQFTHTEKKSTSKLNRKRNIFIQIKVNLSAEKEEYKKNKETSIRNKYEAVSGRRKEKRGIRKSRKQWEKAFTRKLGQCNYLDSPSKKKKKKCPEDLIY